MLASSEVTSASATVWTVKGSMSSAWALRSASPWLLEMNLSTPLGLRVDLAMPLPSVLRSADECNVYETGKLVWRARTLIGGVPGVISANISHTVARGDSVVITVEGGSYAWDMSCSD